MTQDEGKKYATRSLTIFPLTHGPVQVVCSPQSIIFTVVTDGRKADCNYSYRYWGHLEVVSPHWKTEQLLSHKGQVFIISSSVRIHRRTLMSNWMHRHKEATKGHICILENKGSEGVENHKIPALGLNSICRCPVPSLSVWCAFILKTNPLPHGRGHQ